MKKKNVKTTLNWVENGVYLTNIGASKAKKAKNFLTYVFDTPMKVSKMYDFFVEATKKHPTKDASEPVFELEDKALFDASVASAIDIILRHLKHLDQGEENKAHWCYLDAEKKAVVHFINKSGWYAEAYFLGEMELSFLHLVEDDFGHKALVPVMFVKDISEYKAKVAVTGGVYLQEYLPRETFEFLGKNVAYNGKKGEMPANHKEKHRHPRRDKKDNL